jgi:hypothetical protein
MITSATELRSATAIAVDVSEDTLSVDLIDGRTIRVPLTWYPRLFHATPKERTNWRFIGHGEGIHWPDLDEDIRIEHLLVGLPSQESQSSLKSWLDRRPAVSTSIG